MQTEVEFRGALLNLARSDARLEALLDLHGPPPFWHRPPGFPALVLFILEQQVSLASGAATFQRLRSLVGEVTAAGVLSLDDEEFRTAGLSRQKARYVREVAEAVRNGVDLERFAGLGDDEIRRRLMALRGVGPWTADVYLLSCLRRPDIWPVADRALQVATAEALNLAEVPGPSGLAALGEDWRPHRSTAARLLWHAYLSRRGRAEIAIGGL